jgi:hypothetical protein
MCKNGIRQLITVDNFVPVTNGRLAYSSTNGKEMWVVILEKAWAKIHKSYERIEGGDTQLTVRDLTGAPGESFDMKDKDIKIDELWAQVKDADKRDYIICCSTDSMDEEQAKAFKATGLIAGHAYSMIAVAEFDDVKICQIRNPWGSFEWNGDWGDNSHLWTDEIKEKVGFTNADDGAFWMSWDDV